MLRAKTNWGVEPGNGNRSKLQSSLSPSLNGRRKATRYQSGRTFSAPSLPQTLPTHIVLCDCVKVLLPHTPPHSWCSYHTPHTHGAPTTHPTLMALLPHTPHTHGTPTTHTPHSRSPLRLCKGVPWRPQHSPPAQLSPPCCSACLGGSECRP